MSKQVKASLFLERTQKVCLNSCILLRTSDTQQVFHDLLIKFGLNTFYFKDTLKMD